MSEPSQEPSRMSRMRTGVSRWRNTRRGTKTLKAAYSQAARDVKRMDPAVRERIGRANMTRADLQMLADTNIGRQFRPELYGQAAQGLEASAAARVQQAGTSAAPTRNPFRRLANRVSRWRNTRQGTKALKAAYTQAARDVKRMDPAVREAIGRSTVTKADLQAFSQGHMDQVFRPEGRNGALAQQPAQSQQVGAPDQQQVVQPQQAQQQMPQQMVQPQQDRTMQLLAEYNQLQAQAAQLLQTRIAQLQAEAAQLTAMYQAQMAQQAQVAQMLQPEAGQQQQPQREPEVAQQPAEGAPQQVAEGGQEEPEAAQQAPENLHYVGKHRVVETPETFQPGADPADPKNWVDVASGNAPVQPLPQVAGQQEGLDQGTEAGESAAGEPRTGNGQAELSPADMQNMHAAFGGVAKAQGSSGEQARETVAESESGDNGQHRTGQAAGKSTDSSLRR
jgi:hypothetical protein